MGRFARLMPRLVCNLHLRLTQTNCACAKQLLDSALLAPAVVPSASAGAPRQTKSTQGQLHSEAFADPAGILQYLFLTLRGSTHPQEFLEELCRFLLRDEPLAPPVAAFWKLWTSNDLALFYKLLLAHGVDDAALFAQVRARMVMSLQHFSPTDAALVLSAAAEAPRSRLTLELLHPSKPDATSAVAAEAQPGRAVAEPQRKIEEMRPGTNSDERHPHPPAEPLPLFASLLRSFVTQASSLFGVLSGSLSRTASVAIRGSLASVPQQTQPTALSSPPHSLAESAAVGDPCTTAAAWANSLEPLALLARHLRGCVSTASPRATLRVLAAAVTLWGILRSEGQESQLSLRAAVAAASNDAEAADFTDLKGSEGGCGGSLETTAEWWAPSFPEGKLECALSRSLGGCKAGKDCSKGSSEETVDQDTDRQQQEARCEDAVRELLTAAIPALSGSFSDLSLDDCVSLLELLWPLAVSSSFSLPFRWVEAAFAEACLARGGGDGLASLASESKHGKELHVHRKQREVQEEVVAALLRGRIRQEVERKDPELTFNEKRLFKCLLEASGTTFLHQLLISN
ncbi:hypothetical protein Esti_005348 [Eimeria stiedai]